MGCKRVFEPSAVVDVVDFVTIFPHIWHAQTGLYGAWGHSGADNQTTVALSWKKHLAVRGNIKVARSAHKMGALNLHVHQGVIVQAA